MTIKILPAANEDLINGYCFYEQQHQGIGDYFLDSLFADIDSLVIHRGVHSVYFTISTVCWPSGFPLPFITPLKETIS